MKQATKPEDQENQEMTADQKFVRIKEAYDQIIELDEYFNNHIIGEHSRSHNHRYAISQEFLSKAYKDYRDSVRKHQEEEEDEVDNDAEKKKEESIFNKYEGMTMLEIAKAIELERKERK